MWLCVCEGQRTTYVVNFSSYHVDSGNWTQVTRLSHWVILITPRHLFVLFSEIESLQVTALEVLELLLYRPGWLWTHKVLMFLVFVLIACFLRANNQIQGIVLAREVLYHQTKSTTTRNYCFYFPILMDLLILFSYILGRFDNLDHLYYF